MNCFCRAEISILLVSICVFREPKETSLNWRLCIVLFMSNKVSHPSSAWWGTGRSVASPRTCGSRSFSGSPSDCIVYSVQKQLFMSLLYYSLLSSVAGHPILFLSIIVKLTKPKIHFFYVSAFVSIQFNLRMLRWSLCEKELKGNEFEEDIFLENSMLGVKGCAHRSPPPGLGFK